MKAIYNKVFRFRKIILVLPLLALIAGCEIDNLPEEESGELFRQSEFNLEMQALAIAVSNSADANISFRKLMKGEALKMFDGDYDILLSGIADKELKGEDEAVKSQINSITVKSLIENNLPVEYRAKHLKSTASYIDMLTKKYPYLQISVPVKAEEWDEETFVPLVTFIPEEYDELTTTQVAAYKPNGKALLLDAINPPGEPVLVVSMNERVKILEDPVYLAIPPAPFGLNSFSTEAGIRLIWVMPDTANTGNTTGFSVYRKSFADYSYNLIATVPGAYNRSYDDNFVSPGAVYSYYVTAYYQGETSGPSNYITATAPLHPKPVLSFDAIQHARNLVELRWQNDYSQYISATRIYKYTIGETAEYQLLNTFPPSKHDCFVTDIAIGKKTIYKVVHLTELGESDPKYDFIQAPYRDISQGSPVYIKQIKFTDWRIERWLAGKPEFYITVTNVDPVNKNPFKVQDQINCEFSSRSSTSQLFTGKKVLDWQPGFWYDMLTFTALEYDRPSGELKIEIGVKFNTKDILKLSFLEGSGGINYTIVFKDKGEDCGTSYLNYFEDPNSWLIFPNYGVKILVSESDI